MVKQMLNWQPCIYQFHKNIIYSMLFVKRQKHKLFKNVPLIFLKLNINNKNTKKKLMYDVECRYLFEIIKF